MFSRWTLQHRSSVKAALTSHSQSETEKEAGKKKSIFMVLGPQMNCFEEVSWQHRGQLTEVCLPRFCQELLSNFTILSKDVKKLIDSSYSEEKYLHVALYYKVKYLVLCNQNKKSPCFTTSSWSPSAPLPSYIGLMRSVAICVFGS